MAVTYGRNLGSSNRKADKFNSFPVALIDLSDVGEGNLDGIGQNQEESLNGMDSPEAIAGLTPRAKQLVVIADGYPSAAMAFQEK